MLLSADDDTAAPSSVTDSVLKLTPEPPVSSVTVKITGWRAFVTYAPEVGDRIAITGATVSFTTNCSPLSVVPSAVTEVPAVFVASTVTL